MCTSFKMKMHHELQLSILYLIMKFPFTLFSFKAIILCIYYFFLGVPNYMYFHFISRYSEQHSTFETHPFSLMLHRLSSLQGQAASGFC